MTKVSILDKVTKVSILDKVTIPGQSDDSWSKDAFPGQRTPLWVQDVPLGAGRLSGCRTVWSRCRTVVTVQGGVVYPGRVVPRSVPGPGSPSCTVLGVYRARVVYQTYSSMCVRARSGRLPALSPSHSDGIIYFSLRSVPYNSE